MYSEALVPGLCVDVQRLEGDGVQVRWMSVILSLGRRVTSYEVAYCELTGPLTTTHGAVDEHFTANENKNLFRVVGYTTETVMAVSEFRSTCKCVFRIRVQIDDVWEDSAHDFLSEIVRFSYY